MSMMPKKDPAASVPVQLVSGEDVTFAKKNPDKDSFNIYTSYPATGTLLVTIPHLRRS